MKRSLAALFVLSLIACPGPTGKVDPWLTARTIINQTQSAVVLADVIFQQYLLGQPEGDQKEQTKAKYLKIKQAVVNGLKLAYDGVGIAEQAKTDPDVTKLLEKANEAWADLQKLLADLLKTEPTPASLPTGAKGIVSTKRYGPSYTQLREMLAKLPPKLQ